MKKNEPMWKRASSLTTKGEESGWMAEIFGQVVDSPRKLRGARVEYLFLEECFGKGTPIIMSDFSIKNIEEINIGDFVLGIDGMPKEVIKTCSGIDDMYLIEQKKGLNYIVNSKHKLYLESRPRVHNIQDEIKLLNVNEFENLNKYNKRTTFGVKNSKIEYLNDCIDLDPYILGIWLGDGTSKDPEICVNESLDYEISNYIHKYVKNNNLKLTIRNDKKSKCLLNIYYIKGQKNGKNPFYSKLKEYNLINNKHIPKEVFKSTLNYRLNLLAGLIDTDGHLHYKDGSYEITFGMSRKYLIKDIAILARSCGFYVSESERIIKSFNKEFKAFNLRISGQLNEIPTKVKRKQVPFSYISKTNKLSSRIKIKKIEKK